MHLLIGSVDKNSKTWSKTWHRDTSSSSTSGISGNKVTNQVWPLGKARPFLLKQWRAFHCEKLSQIKLQLGRRTVAGQRGLQPGSDYLRHLTSYFQE